VRPIVPQALASGEIFRKADVPMEHEPGFVQGLTDAHDRLVSRTEPDERQLQGAETSERVRKGLSGVIE
jgi:hypothetical protein